MVTSLPHLLHGCPNVFPKVRSATPSIQVPLNCYTGFERFYPKGTKAGSNGGNAAKPKENPTVSGGGGTGSGSGGAKQSGKGDPKDSLWYSIPLAIGLLLFLEMTSGEHLKEVTWQDFRNNLLAHGKVSRRLVHVYMVLQKDRTLSTAH
jgi:hypothetical protein